MTSPRTIPLPDDIQESATQEWQAFLEACAEACLVYNGDDWLAGKLQAAFVCSEFASTLCRREPALLLDLIDSGDLFVDYPPQELMRRLAAQTAELTNEHVLMQVLREFRSREMLRIVLRDLIRFSDLQITMRELSWLAEASIECALGVLSRLNKPQFGLPYNGQGKQQHLAVLGMGKLGAHELNVSSDIDLIFVYGEEGRTRGGRMKLDNSEYFTRLGQRLISVLDQNTADGFVFRVDMRLRPFGDSGPLAISLDALEDYYQTHGREWERYAMIKARVVAGDRDLGDQIMATLKPFIFRRYLDYGSFESLRDMKRMIAREVARKGLQNNVKLGPGGIREIEFIGQAFQLIRGGREPALQIRPILKVLDELLAKGLLPEFVVAELKSAYVFLRDTEHRIQMRRDEQTHNLPQDEEEQFALAFSMGATDWPAFVEQLESHRGNVQGHFEQVFAEQRSDAAKDEVDLVSVWQDNLDADEACAQLVQAGFDDGETAIRRIQALRESYACRALSTQGRARMDRLMPLMLGAIGQLTNSDEALGRVLNVVERIAQRTAYLALLVENPMVLSQLVKLCGASPWITEFLAQHPLLLDELLDARSLYAPLSKRELQEVLRRRLASIDADDLERNMDELRHFKQTQVLRVAAADVNADMPLMKVSDHLTDIAEVVLEQALQLAWQYMVARHGRPPCVAGGEQCDTGFAIIGYGKLGGIELGYGSDLDLVFLYVGDDEARTDGKKPLDLPVFYARLAQRLTHILNTQTPAGILYEIDLRLRPDGAAGLLVSHVDAFAEYQSGAAWTWEHQALVRARFITGDPLIMQHFARTREQILARKRRPDTLREEVSEMRRRMRDELGSHEAGMFDLKQDAGGIADIEFLVQYGVLRWAAQSQELLYWSDNIRLLDALVTSGHLDADDGQCLADAYRAYRSEVHRLTLLGQPARVSDTCFSAERAAVIKVWQQYLQT
jgi:glutamate-ammonia-ligase adenylyltransferase